MVASCSVETVDWLDSTTDFANEDQQHPVLIDFRPKRKAEDFDNADVKLKAAKTDTDGKFEPEEITAEVEGLEYRGFRTVENADIDTFILARNKNTGECHLIETEMLFTVFPSRYTRVDPVSSEEEEEEEEEVEEDDSKTPLSRLDKRQQLLYRFGSSKSRNTFKNYRREMEQKIDNKVATQYTEKAGAMIARQKEASASTPSGDGTSRHLAPPHNIDAKTPAEAYPLEILLTEQEFQELSNQASNALAELRDAAAPKNPGWHDFAFRLMLQNAHDISNETLRHRRAMACFYLNLIIQLIRVPSRLSISAQRQISEKLKIYPNHLQVLLERFMQRENDSAVFVRTQALSDSLIYTGAVLWLTIEGFRNCKGIGELAAALNVTPKEMAMFVVRVGGKLSKSKNKNDDFSNYRARLAIPLKFPSIQVTRRRKSRSSMK